MSIDVSTSQYEFSHGRKPRGQGYWAFRIGRDPEPVWSVLNQSYSQALSDARKLAVLRSANSITVLP